MNNKKEKGITLIALVVTIVILLILAGISMTMVIGENGIIKKAKDARENQVHSAVKEGIILSHNQYTIEDGTGESNSTTFKDYIEGKGIIDENGIINVVNLLGKKQHLGNGSNTETGDVYVFEESDDVYRVKYYDEKKEEHLIDEFEKGSTGEDWEETDPSLFEITEDGTISVKDYWAYYYGSKEWTVENVVIPEKIDGIVVKNIADNFFKVNGKENIKSIKIPNTVTFIGEYAFRYCPELEDVIISEGVTSLSIADRAFEGCYELASITIPEGVTEIGADAFAGCNKLISISIPSSLATIGDNAFGFVNGEDRPLKSIKVSKENKNYDSRNNCNALIETSTNTLILGCNNTIIPDSIIKIGYSAFRGCHQLKDIIIPEGVVEIKHDAFRGCYGLNSIDVVAGNKNYDSRNNCNALIETATNTLILGCNNTIIPDSIIKIGDWAFEGCNQLKDIIIPEGVVEIGYDAFGGCSGLNSIGVAAGNKKYDSRNDCNALIETSTNTLILGCKNTIIPDSIIKIGKYAFEGCDQLKDIIIPNGVVNIESEAFEGAGLEKIQLPNSLTSIGWSAFRGCSALKIVNYTGTKEEWSKVTIVWSNDPLTNATIVYNYTPSNQ